MNKEKNIQKLEVLKKYQTYLIWLLEKINSFPKKQKYLLGERIGNQAFDILESLLKMQYSPSAKKKENLSEFNLKLENLRQLMRIAWKMKFISNRNFLWQETKIDEVGRMAHGLAHFSKNQ